MSCDCSPKSNFKLHGFYFTCVGLLAALFLSVPVFIEAAELDTQLYFQGTGGTKQPYLVPEKVRNTKRNLEDLWRRQEIERIEKKLEIDRLGWEGLSSKLDAEMAHVMEMVRENRKLEAWAGVIKGLIYLGAIGVRLGVGSTESGVGSSKPKPKDGVYIKQHVKQIIKKCKEGNCEIEIQEVINSYQTHFNKLGGHQGKFIRNLSSKVGSIIGELGASTLQCDYGGERCFIPNDTVSVFSKEVFEFPIAKKGKNIPSATLGQQVFSLLMDFLPYLGTAKSWKEFVDGKDPITGEKISKTVAAVGLVASFTPGGKVVVKFGGKILKRVKYISKSGIVVVGEKSPKVIRGPRAFRHYTDDNGLNGIKETGWLKVKDKNAIHVTKITKKNPLSYADAKRLLFNNKDSRGKHFVEFILPKGYTVEYVRHVDKVNQEWVINSNKLKLLKEWSVLVER